MVLRYITICLIWLIVNGVSLWAQVGSPVKDLPLQLTVSEGSKSAFIIYISGDGGWNEFNQKLVQAFEKQGYGVVTLNSAETRAGRKIPTSAPNEYPTMITPDFFHSFI